MSEREAEPAAPSSREVELGHPQIELLGRLMRSDALRTGDVPLAYREVTEAAANALGVERASVWRLDRERASIECVDLHYLSSGVHERGVTLTASDYPQYFQSLVGARVIAAHHAQKDPRTREFADGYLRPAGITSMLDAPILVRGELVGILCHEHVGPPRTWQLWEELCAGTLADFVALALEAAERAERELELDRAREELERRVAQRTAELAASEEGIRQVLAAAPLPIVLTRASDSTVLFANERAATVFEVPIAEVEGQRAPDYYVDPTRREELVARVRETGRVEDFEAEVRTRSGHTFWVLLSAQRMTFKGEPALIVGAHDISRLKRVERELVELATKDALTGILNRRHFLEVAEAEVERARRYGHPLTLAMLDIDHFKGVNDQFGHDIGDEVLRMVARTCQSGLRSSDALGRYGGEELTIVFPESDLDAAVAVCERLRRAIAEEEISTTGGVAKVTVSFGVASSAGGDETLHELLKRSDVALYKAKGAGRNRVDVA